MRGSTSCTNFTRLSDSNRTSSAANVCLPRAASRFSKTPFAIESIGTSAGRDNEVCFIQQAEKLAIVPELLARHKFIAHHKSMHKKIMGRSSQISGTALCTHTSSLEKKCQPISYLGFHAKSFQIQKGNPGRIAVKAFGSLGICSKGWAQPIAHTGCISQWSIV